MRPALPLQVSHLTLRHQLTPQKYENENEYDWTQSGHWPAGAPRRCVFGDRPIPFLQFLFGSRFRGKKKALSLSVDLEPIEVIMIFAAALWK